MMIIGKLLILFVGVLYNLRSEYKVAVWKTAAWVDSHTPSVWVT